jgi:hypothetical protein
VALGAGPGATTVNVGSAANALDPIQAPVTVTGGGNATLNFRDQGGNPAAAPGQAYNYSLAPGSFSRTGTATVSFGGMAAVNVYAANAGGGSLNALDVAGTAPGTTYGVYAGTGLNEFLVFDADHTLNGIQGKLFLHGAGGFLPNNNAVFLDDIDKATRHTFFVDAGATPQSGVVTRANTAGGQPDMAPISYDGLNAYAVLFTAGSAGATVNVRGLAPDLLTIVSAGAGDAVHVGNASHTLDALQGDLVVQGGTPAVTFDDTADAGAKSVTLAADGSNGYLVKGLLPAGAPGRGRVWLQLDPAAPVAVNTGPVGATFLVHDLVGAPALVLNGRGGKNALHGPDTANTWQVSGPNAGTLDGVVRFAGIQNLTGGASGDTFQVQTGGSLDGQVDGGGGTNALDYSAYRGDVTVDLPLGFATALAGGVRNIQNVTGSLGNDILVGDANVNALRGGTGRNLIVGGAGADQLFGGGGDNILIGGTTSYGQNLTGLQAIMAEWTSADSYATRVRKIGSGVVGSDGKTYALVGGKGPNRTVFDDGGAPDVLTGTPNTDPSVLDWLFSNTGTDQLVNTKAKDVRTAIF